MGLAHLVPVLQTKRLLSRRALYIYIYIYIYTTIQRFGVRETERDRQTCREGGRERDRHADRERQRETGMQRQRDRHADRERDRHADRETEAQTYIYIYRSNVWGHLENTV